MASMISQDSIRTFLGEFLENGFYKTQTECAQEIVMAFVGNEDYEDTDAFVKYRFATLLAQMQSGKSGTYLLVALLMKHMNVVDNVLIMCGSNDNELYTQVEENLDNALTKYSGIFSVSKDVVKHAFKCVKSCHLKGLSINQKTLVIWDESHYAQTDKQLPDIFFRDNGLLVNATKKAEEQWERKHSYLLTVSATPFSEISNAFNHKDDIRKKVCILHPNGLYRGVKYYRDNKLIHRSFNIKTDPVRLHTLLDHHFDIINPKYALIRTQDDEEEEIIQRIAMENDWNVVYHNAKTPQPNGFNALEEKPTKCTIWMIKGMGRMGKVVPKKHVAFVFETAETSNADTLLQSLLGRMCGYNVGDNYPSEPIHIYVTPSFMEQDEKNLEKLVKKHKTMLQVYKNKGHNDDKVEKMEKELTYLRELEMRCDIDRYIALFDGEIFNVLPKTGKNMKSSDKQMFYGTLSTIPEVLNDNGEDYNNNPCKILHYTDKGVYRDVPRLSKEQVECVVLNVINMMEEAEDNETYFFGDKVQHKEVYDILFKAYYETRDYKHIVFRNFNKSSYQAKQLHTKLRNCIKHKCVFDDLSQNTHHLSQEKFVTIGYFGAYYDSETKTFKHETEEDKNKFVITAWTFDGDKKTYENAMKRSQTMTTGKEVYARQKTIVYRTEYLTEPLECGIDAVYVKKTDVLTLLQFEKLMTNPISGLKVSKQCGDKYYPSYLSSYEYERFLVVNTNEGFVLNSLL